MGKGAGDGGGTRTGREKATTGISALNASRANTIANDLVTRAERQPGRIATIRASANGIPSIMQISSGPDRGKYAVSHLPSGASPLDEYRTQTLANKTTATKYVARILRQVTVANERAAVRFNEAVTGDRSRLVSPD